MQEKSEYHLSPQKSPEVNIQKLLDKRVAAEHLLEEYTIAHLTQHPDVPPPLTLDLMGKTGYSYTGLGNMYDELRKENHPDWPVRPKKGRRLPKQK